MLTQSEVQRALPATLKSAATQELVDKLNQIAVDPLVAEDIRNNFISYTGVLKDGKFKTEDYLHAVTYVSFKLMGYTNQDAYIRTFPDRYKALLAKGTEPKDVAAYVSAYNRGKLVNAIIEQTMIPTWVLNQDLYQKAINNLAIIGFDDDVSPKVRVEALTSLATQLKRPEVQKHQLNMTVEESSGMNELKESLKLLAEKQLELVESGVSPKLIAASPLVEAEFTEVDADQTEPRRVVG